MTQTDKSVLGGFIVLIDYYVLLENINGFYGNYIYLFHLSSIKNIYVYASYVDSPSDGRSPGNSWRNRSSRLPERTDWRSCSDSSFLCNSPRRRTLTLELRLKWPPSPLRPVDGDGNVVEARIASRLDTVCGCFTSFRLDDGSTCFIIIIWSARAPRRVCAGI